MQPRSNRPDKKKALTFMLLDGAGSNARRFQITSRHVKLAIGLWIAAMLLFVYLGFQLG